MAAAAVGEGRGPAGLLSLPVELLYDIHLLSISPTLPILNRRALSIFANSSIHHRAAFLWRHHHFPDLTHYDRFQGIHSWAKELRHPCCSLEVLEVLRRWTQRRRMRVGEIPKRLFRSLPASSSPVPSPSETTTVDPLLFALLKDPYSLPHDKLSGYPLSRAVLARHIPLVRALLDSGADPGTKDALAVRVAVGQGDLNLVRMLVEPDFRLPEETGSTPDEASSTSSEGEPSQQQRGWQPDGRWSSSSPGKRRKLGDRVKVTDGMLESAIRRGFLELAEWLMSKGATPTIQALRLLEAHDGS